MNAAEYDLDDPQLLFRPDVLENPKPLYRLLRERAPVWEIPGSSTFLVTSMRLVNEAAARTNDFSSKMTSLMYRNDDGLPAVFDMGDVASSQLLATADPPVHTAQRKLFQPRFAPRSVAQLEHDICAMVDELIASLQADGAGDAVGGLADPLPAQVIARLIGLPTGDWTKVVKWVFDLDELLAGIVGFAEMQTAATALVETNTYLAEHLTQALERADDGSLLSLAAAAIRNGSISFEEGVGLMVLMLTAGTETTTSLIATAIRTLASDAAVQTLLRENHELIPAFVEEVLRLDGPFQFHYRSTPRETELDGVHIPAGSRVLLMWAAANLDDAEYENPEQLDLDRPIVRSHVAFGRGIHFCIGAPLARLEAKLALEGLLTRTSWVQLDASAPPRLHPSIFLRRHLSLPIVIS